MLSKHYFISVQFTFNRPHNILSELKKRKKKKRNGPRGQRISNDCKQWIACYWLIVQVCFQRPPFSSPRDPNEDLPDADDARGRAAVHFSPAKFLVIMQSCLCLGTPGSDHKGQARGPTSSVQHVARVFVPLCITLPRPKTHSPPFVDAATGNARKPIRGNRRERSWPAGRR